MHCWARYLFITLVSVLGIGQMIAACGQKGDLYLPEPKKEAPQQTAADTEKKPQVRIDEVPKTQDGATADAEVGQPDPQ